MTCNSMQLRYEKRQLGHDFRQLGKNDLAWTQNTN